MPAPSFLRGLNSRAVGQVLIRVRQTFDGFPNEPSSPTNYWTFAYETCADTKCTMTAKGNEDTPVEGAKVVLVLSGDGTGEVTWEGF